MDAFVLAVRVVFTPAVVTEGDRVTLTCSTSCALSLNTSYVWTFAVGLWIWRRDKTNMWFWTQWAANMQGATPALYNTTAGLLIRPSLLINRRAVCSSWRNCCCFPRDQVRLQTKTKWENLHYWTWNVRQHWAGKVIPSAGTVFSVWKE